MGMEFVHWVVVGLGFGLGYGLIMWVLGRLLSPAPPRP
jgi:hypothetical protein